MDAPEPVTPARDVATDDDDGVKESQPLPKVHGSVVLAQPAITPPAPVSKTPELTVDADGAQPQKSGGPLLTFLMCDVRFALRILRILFKCPFDFGLLSVNNLFYV